MGVMLEGRYQAEDPEPQTDAEGTFRRRASTIRDWIGTAAHPAEPGRYHLYVAWNCPWAHRALLGRAWLGLEAAVSASFARPNRTDQGWVYDATGDHADPELGVSALHEVYARQPEPYTGRVTVPVLWDRVAGRIVSNESADILRMLPLLAETDTLRPSHLATEIDAWNTLIHDHVNNGVYKAGFATTQSAYDTAVTAVFDTLDRIEDHLDRRDWLVGDQLTEADLRLFPTLARFDVAYHYAFKCNIRRLTDYPNLWHYARTLYAFPTIAGTVRFDIYKQGYFSRSELRNPLGIVPMGPVIDWSL